MYIDLCVYIYIHIYEEAKQIEQNVNNCGI